MTTQATGTWDPQRDALYPNWATLAARYDIGPPRHVSARGAVVPVIGCVGDEPDVVDLVVAQTCIDHAAGDPAKLSASVVADLVFGHVAAWTLGAPLLHCFGTGEELHVVPRGGRRRDGWRAVMERIGAVLDDLEPPRAGRHVVETADPDVWELACEVVAADGDTIADEDLDGLYRLHPEEPFPRSTPYTYFYRYYRHNVARYRTSLLAAVTGTPARAVVVVEDAQQVKAVHRARLLNAREGSTTTQLVTLPAPSRSGATRAMRASGADAVPMPESATDLPPSPYWAAVAAAWTAFRAGAPAGMPRQEDLDA